jgi:hypothetical protein
MVKRIDHVGDFEARNGQGGSRTLRVFVPIISTANLKDPRGERRGRPYILTAEGYHVNSLGEGRYEVVETGEDLSSDDPDAF